MLFLSLVACKDPGYIKREDVSFTELVEVFDSVHLCADCGTIRTSRSRHCYICNRCVERYDHHCPWINNCVGVNNHNSFYLFVGFMGALLCISLVQSFYVLSKVIQQEYPIFATTVSFLPRLPAPVFITLLAIEILLVGMFFFPVVKLCLT